MEGRRAFVRNIIYDSLAVQVGSCVFEDYLHEPEKAYFLRFLYFEAFSKCKEIGVRGVIVYA